MSRVLRLVEVWHEGAWYPGEMLGEWRRVDGRWRCVVRWRTQPGYQYQQGRWEGEVRPQGHRPPGT